MSDFGPYSHVLGFVVRRVFIIDRPLREMCDCLSHELNSNRADSVRSREDNSKRPDPKKMEHITVIVCSYAHRRTQSRVDMIDVSGHEGRRSVRIHGQIHQDSLQLGQLVRAPCDLKRHWLLFPIDATGSVVFDASLACLCPMEMNYFSCTAFALSFVEKPTAGSPR